MKLAAIFLSIAAAAVSAQSCDKVSVVGDGTFCIQGPVCSGSLSNPGGKACPKVGDTVVSDCFPSHPSYNKATGKCTAPVPADCKPISSGAWGCVWDLSKLPTPAPSTSAPATPGPTTPAPVTPGPTTPAPVTPGPTTPAPVTPAPSTSAPVTPGPTTPAPVTPGPTTPAPVTPSPTTPAPAGCTKVSVVGDGTFCIQGPVCSGTSSNPGGKLCPKVGDTAVSDCYPTHPSYNKATGKCTAPVQADCKPISSGAWGCVWDLSKLPTPAPSSATPPTPPSTSTPGGPPPTSAPTTPAPACDKVSVVGDGTFCIQGSVCSGTSSNPGGKLCPKVGDTAISDCFPTHPSYNKATGKCTAPVPADCKPLSSGAWGCVWDLSKLPTPGPTTPGPVTPAPTTPAPACSKVSVVGDGTFCIQGPVCSGTSSNPGGKLCPKVGDTAVSDCFPTHPSYNKVTGKCTAPVPADCKPLNSGAWGCVWDLSKLPPSPAKAATTFSAAGAATGAGSSSGAVVGIVAAVAAIAVAVVGVVMYKKRQTQSQRDATFALQLSPSERV